MVTSMSTRKSSLLWFWTQMLLCLFGLTGCGRWKLWKEHPWFTVVVISAPTAADEAADWDPALH